jgi:hypothetical protein
MVHTTSGRVKFTNPSRRRIVRIARSVARTRTAGASNGVDDTRSTVVTAYDPPAEPVGRRLTM